ncbi:unnamed protein product [Ixodes hexagonus]
MNQKEAQRVCVKFCVKLGETLQKLFRCCKRLLGINVQSSQWKTKSSPTPKKARKVKSNVKVMLTVFFDWKGVVYYEFLPRGETINRFRYLETLRHLRETARRKRLELWRSGEWVEPRQRACSFCVARSRLLHKKRHDRHPPAPVLTRPGPCGLFPVSETQEALERADTSLN